MEYLAFRVDTDNWPTPKSQLSSQHSESEASNMVDSYGITA